MQPGWAAGSGTPRTGRPAPGPFRSPDTPADRGGDGLGATVPDTGEGDEEGIDRFVLQSVPDRVLVPFR